MEFTINAALGSKYKSSSILDELVNLPPPVLAKTIPFSNSPGRDDFILQAIRTVLLENTNAHKVCCSQADKEQVFLRLNRDIENGKLSLDLRMKLKSLRYDFFGLTHIESLIESCAKDELTLMNSLIYAFGKNHSSDSFSLIKKYKTTLLAQFTNGSKSYKVANIVFDMYIRNQLLAKLSHIDSINLNNLVMDEKLKDIPGNITVQRWCAERIMSLESEPDCRII